MTTNQDVGKTDIDEWVVNTKPFYANVKDGDFRVGIYERQNSVGTAYGDTEKEAVNNAQHFAHSKRMLELLKKFHIDSTDETYIQAIVDVNLFLNEFENKLI